MTIVYRTTGAWGAGQGSNLSAAQVDGNFHDLDQRVDALGAGPAPAEIDTISLSGNTLTITLDDARFFEVTVPTVTFTFRGDWTASTAYLANDVFEVADVGTFVVTYDHTSDTTFDAAYDPDTLGYSAYHQMAGTVSGAASVATVSGTTHGPTAEVTDGVYVCTNATACAVTIPAEASEDFEVGSRLLWLQSAAGPVSVSGAGGVTLSVPTGFSATSAFEGAWVWAVKTGADAWAIGGDLTADTPTELTISGGAITPTVAGTIPVDTEADAASDDLDTITATNMAGDEIIILKAADSARSVVVKDGTGNIVIGADFTLDHVRDRIALQWDAGESVWVLLYAQSNGT